MKMLIDFDTFTVSEWHGPVVLPDKIGTLKSVEQQMSPRQELRDMGRLIVRYPTLHSVTLGIELEREVALFTPPTPVDPVASPIEPERRVSLEL